MNTKTRYLLKMTLPVALSLSLAAGFAAAAGEPPPSDAKPTVVGEAGRSGDSIVSSADLQACEADLAEYVKGSAARDFHRWPEMGNRLREYSYATVLVRVSLENNVYDMHKVGMLLKELSSSEIVATNLAGKRAIYFLMHGRAGDLVTIAHPELKKVFLLDDLSFQVLAGREVGGGLLDHLSKNVIGFTETGSARSADERLRLMQNDGPPAFVLWDLSTGNMLFAFAKRELDLIADRSKFGSPQDMAHLEVPATADLADWMVRNRDKLGERVLIEWGNYHIFSDAAYKLGSTRDFFHLGRAGHLTIGPHVGSPLAASLSRCIYGEPCVENESAVAEPAQRWSWDELTARKLVPMDASDRYGAIDFLRAHAGVDFNGDLSDFGVRRLFESVFRRYFGSEPYQAAVKKIEELTFKKTDGSGIYHSDSAQTRFVRAWLLLLAEAEVSVVESASPFDKEIQEALAERLEEIAAKRPHGDKSDESGKTKQRRKRGEKGTAAGKAGGELEVTPTKGSLNHEKALHILDILRDQVGSGAMRAEGNFRSVILSVIQRLGMSESRRQAEDLIKEIDFKTAEYRLLKRERVSEPALQRLEKTWRILSALVGVDPGENLSLKSIREVGQLIKNHGAGE